MYFIAPDFAAPGGYTPLHIAAEIGSIGATKCLIHAKANVQAKMDDVDEIDAHISPLHLAVQVWIRRIRRQNNII